MRKISERNLETDEDLCACFIECYKAFDRIKWTKLMHTQRKLVPTGIKDDWPTNCKWIRALKYDKTKRIYEV